jgi:RNA polymerase sigma factor (sigma-70 family)
MILDELEAGNRLEQVARQVIRELIRRPGYGFLEEDEFIQQALPIVLADQECRQAATSSIDPTNIIKRRIKNHYSTRLYTQILAGKAADQNRGYAELSRYLYQHAYNLLFKQGCPSQLVPDQAEDATQGALIRIHTYVVGKINKPGLFYYFALQNLKNECYRMQKEARISGSWAKFEQNDTEAGVELENLQAANTEEAADLLDCVLTAILRLPNKDWRAALILTYFSGWGDDEIASQVLHTSKGNLQVMRSRAIAQLRADLELRKCLES